MTRETKIGLIVVTTFLALLGVVVASKLRPGDDPTPEGTGTLQVAQGGPEKDPDKRPSKGEESSPPPGPSSKETSPMPPAPTSEPPLPTPPNPEPAPSPTFPGQSSPPPPAQDPTLQLLRDAKERVELAQAANNPKPTPPANEPPIPAPAPAPAPMNQKAAPTDSGVPLPPIPGGANGPFNPSPPPSPLPNSLEKNKPEEKQAPPMKKDAPAAPSSEPPLPGFPGVDSIKIVPPTNNAKDKGPTPPAVAPPPLEVPPVTQSQPTTEPNPLLDTVTKPAPAPPAKNPPPAPPPGLELGGPPNKASDQPPPAPPPAAGFPGEPNGPKPAPKVSALPPIGAAPLPSAPAGVTAPKNDARPNLDNRPPLGAPASELPAVVTPASQPSVGQPSIGLPSVNISSDEKYLTRPEDTSFAALSRRFYGSEKYAAALLEYNRRHPVTDAALQQDPPVLKAGQAVMKPPVNVLELRHGNLIANTPAAAPMSTPAVRIATPVPLTPTGLGQPTGTPSPDPSVAYRVPQAALIFDVARETLGSGHRWPELYRLNPTLRTDAPIPAGTEIRVPAKR